MEPSHSEFICSSHSFTESFSLLQRKHLLNILREALCGPGANSR